MEGSRGRSSELPTINTCFDVKERAPTQGVMRMSRAAVEEFCDMMHTIEVCGQVRAVRSQVCFCFGSPLRDCFFETVDVEKL